MLQWKRRKIRNDIRLNYKVIWINSAIFLLIVYFIYHSISGERGVLAYFKLQKEFTNKNIQFSNLLEQKKILDEKVKAMHPQSLDVDMLDELARKQLGMIGQDEKVINIKPEDLVKEWINLLKSTYNIVAISEAIRSVVDNFKIQ